MAFLLFLLLVKATMVSLDTLEELPDNTNSQATDNMHYMVNREVHEDIRINASTTIW